MTQSPLQFAREFEKLKSDLRTQPAPDLQLLQLSDFWTSHSALFRDVNFRSYLDEFQPLLLHLITDSTLFDMTLDELQRVRKLLSDLGESAEVADKLKLVTQRLSQLYSYVGEVDQAEALCLPPPPTGEGSTAVAEISPLPLGEGLGERATINARDEGQGERATINGRDEGLGERDTIFHNRATCLFVERDDSGKTARGRMRTLIGRVELSGKSTPTDEITFANQIKTPDDPFIGVAYDSLDALRQVFKTQGMKNQASSHYHAHFQIENSEHTFTGDSIGLALSLIAYTQLLKPEMLRLDRFLSGEVAFTGGVEKSGQVSPVSEETLALKIERAFFSPVKSLALPDANLDSARRHLEKLKGTYPHRHLALIPVERLADALDDHNIVRSEKVCIGQFVAKKAYKYTRTAKVQIPLLVALLYLALCLLYPKAWVGFDWRIDHLEIQDKHFRAINSGGHTLWQSGEFATPLDPGPYTPGASGLARAFCANDVNSDRKDELFFLPMYSGDQGNSTDLQFYDSEGGLVWSQPTSVRTTYPGDTATMGYDQDVKYSSGAMIPIQSKTSGSCVLTSSYLSTPYRHQLLLFNAAGQIVTGPYLHTGQFSGENTTFMRDINGDGHTELILGGTNNRYERACLVVIDPERLSGVAPPYDNELFIASHMPKGSQIRYVAFPKTELSKGDQKKNWVKRVIASASSPLTLEVGVIEGDGLYINGRKYCYYNPDDLPGVTYSLDSNFIPTGVDFADHDFAQLNDLLKRAGKKPYSDPDSLCEALRRDVVVYWGDSIVYHPASGIDFHDK